MDTGEFVVSAHEKVRIFVALLYVLICLIVYRRLFPRLSTTSQLLASLFLAAQIIVLVVWLGYGLTSESQGRRWHLDKEANIPASVSSIQLALVGAVAVITAWVARGWQARHRLHMAALGLVFLFFAWDEFFPVHEQIGNWEILYAVLGAVVVATTVLVAASSPRRSRIWYICLLAGLTVGATGGIAVEQLRYTQICESLGFFVPNDRQCLLYNIEESLEFLGAWLTLVALLGHLSDAVSGSQSRRVMLVLYIFPAIVFCLHIRVAPLRWELEAALREVNREFSRFQSEFSRLAMLIEYQILFQPASIQYKSRVELQAYRIDSAEGVFAIELLASTPNWHSYSGLGYSLHLVDQDTAESVAQTDSSASRRRSWRITEKSYMYKQRFEVHVPQEMPTNRALWVVLTLWRKEGDVYVRQKIISSDSPLLSETQVILSEFVMQAEPVASSSIPIARFENGFTLDAVDLPERAQAGETMPILFAWRTDADGREDFVQFLHLGHEVSGAWWVHDQQPLGPRLPTRVWYSGLGDSETWEVPLPADLAPGRYTVFTGLYRAGDQARLPATDAEGTSFVDARVPLGVLTIEGA